MDSLWKSVSEAADKAKAAAKVVSQKGLEFAEATAEEAGKKLKDLGISEALAAPIAQQNVPSAQELEAYGITPSFIQFICTLNYNTFRDFHSDSMKPTDAPTPGIDAPSAPTLNPWQVRHATLVVRAVKEVNELRYVLSPRYMDDQRFWSVYFQLTKSNLPAIAMTWTDGDNLPAISGSKREDDQFMSFTALHGHFTQIGSKIQAAATNAATRARSGPGLELTAVLGQSDRSGTQAATTAAIASSGDGDVAAPVQPVKLLLEADPDVEAYLRDINQSGGRLPRTGEEGGDAKEGGDDLDLDEYLNELSAETGEIDDVDDGVDVDAVLRELQEENDSGTGEADNEQAHPPI